MPLFSNQALGIALFSYDGGLYWVMTLKNIGKVKIVDDKIAVSTAAGDMLLEPKTGKRL